jgi:UDP-N-acetylglucosamine acyltransferase
MSGSDLAQARTRLSEMAGESEDVRAMLEFIESGQRALLR